MSLFSQTTQSLRLSPMYIAWLILHICYVNIALIFFITFAQMTLSKCSIWHKVLESWHCFKASGFVAQHETLRTLAGLEFIFIFKKFYWRFYLYYPWREPNKWDTFNFLSNDKYFTCEEHPVVGIIFSFTNSQTHRHAHHILWVETEIHFSRNKSHLLKKGECYNLIIFL